MCEILKGQQPDYELVGRHYVKEVGFRVLRREVGKMVEIAGCLEQLFMRKRQRFVKEAYFRLYVRKNNNMLEEFIHRMVLYVPIKPEIFLLRIMRKGQVKENRHSSDSIFHIVHTLLLLRKSYAFHKCLNVNKIKKGGQRFSVSRLIEKKVSQSLRLMKPLGQLKPPPSPPIDLNNLVSIGTKIINSSDIREKRHTSHEPFKSAQNIKQTKSNRYKCRTFDKPSISSLLKQRQAKTPHKRQASTDNKSEAKSKTNIALEESLTRIGRTYSITYENDSSERSSGSCSSIKLNVIAKNPDKTSKLSKFANNKRGRSQIYPIVKKIKHVYRNSQEYQSSRFGLDDEDECCSIIQEDDDESDSLLFLDNKQAQCKFPKTKANNIVASFLGRFSHDIRKTSRNSTNSIKKLQACTTIFIKLQNVCRSNQYHFFNNVKFGSCIGSTTFDSETLQDQIRTLERHEELLDKVTQYETTIQSMKRQLLQYVEDIEKVQRSRQNLEQKSKRMAIQSICRVLNLAIMETLSFSIDNFHSY